MKNNKKTKRVNIMVNPEYWNLVSKANKGKMSALIDHYLYEKMKESLIPGYKGEFK